jgi:uncharacterized protein (DUF1015 family)
MWYAPLMAEIAPLKPLRYDLARLASSGGLGAVVAPPYDVISPAGRAELVARHPHNIVKLDLPEGEGDAKYENAARLFAAWREQGVLVRDEVPAFYRYEQTFRPPGGGPSRQRRGFLGLVKLVPLSAGIVLPHERTHSGPKEDRLKLSRATKAALSPGFVLYRDADKKLDSALDRAEPIASFKTQDEIEHRLAKITDPASVRAIVEGVRSSSLLIADGHHRYETALGYAEEGGAGEGEHRWYLAFFANGDDPDLVVFPTHRHVHDLAKFDFAELCKGAEALFDVTQLTATSADALLAELARSGQTRPSLVACTPDGRAAVLALKAGADLARHPVLGTKVEALRRTDVALLHMGLLQPVLGITAEMQEAKTHIWYPQDAAAALADLKAGKGQVLFLMNATPVTQVRSVAEAGSVMPQKSTFFYPKVLTGLCIHTLDPSRMVAVP